MAKRRMFTQKIIDSDAFLDMPLSAQALYFHLSMRADDDGFVNNPKKIQRMIGASGDDLRLLIVKSFIIAFETGVIVIKHWKMHNYIQSDRYEPTQYQEEKNMLHVKDNKSYSLVDGNNTETLENEQCIHDGYETDTKMQLGEMCVLSDAPTEISETTAETLENEQCIQNVSKMYPQVRLGKVRLGKDNNIYSPAIEEIVAYLNERCNTNYKATTRKTRDLIKARLDENFTVDDFKRVIDIKAQQWENNSKMKDYLRPQTLFGTKFESYLNQKPTTNNPFLDYVMGGGGEE